MLGEDGVDGGVERPALVLLLCRSGIRGDDDVGLGVAADVFDL